MEIKAFAKINLYLDVVGKRDDGYHDLVTVMQSVSLCDVITAEADDHINLTCSDESIPCDSRNIAWKCAAAFFDKTGLTGGVRLHIEKHIPSQAGLGGGSADGAAVLHALNRIYSAGLSVSELAVIGGTVGADIPFCVTGGCCLCTGTGEVYAELEDRRLYLCIAKGSGGISTAQAYGAVDALEECVHQSEKDVLEQYRENRLPLYNIFEKAAEGVKDVYLLKEHFSHLGVPSLMTGSGSAVFGVFESIQKAAKAAEKLRRMGFFAEPAETI